MTSNKTSLCREVMTALVCSVSLAWACSPDFDALTGGTKSGRADPFAGAAGTTADSAGLGGSASSGGTNAAGEAGAAASTAGTVACAGSEICNGIDDNCNDTVDEGCPTGLTWDLFVDRVQLGESQGGGPFSEQCDPSEVLVGLNVRIGAWLDQVAGICEGLSVETDQAETPYAFRVGLHGKRFLPGHPNTTTRLVEMICPPHHMLVGLMIGSQTSIEGPSTFLVIRSIGLRCAEPHLSQSADGWMVTWDNVVEVGPESGAVGGAGERFTSDTVNTGVAATRVHGATGAWVDRVGLGEAPIRVILRGDEAF